MLHSEGVIVTGAGDSVGRVIAEKFARGGARVHICDVRQEALSKTLAENPGLSGSLADISNPKDVERLFLEASENFSQLGILVNCVGIGGPRGPLEEIDVAAWRETFEVNLHGLFYTMRAAIPLMKAGGCGAIVNFSTSSTRTRLPQRSAYVASKFAVEGMTLNAARELGPFGIRCNAILPGIIDNARMRSIIEARAAAEDVEPSVLESEYLRFISMRAKVSPEEIADTVVFLASDQARHITGELIAVSGNLEWEA